MELENESNELNDKFSWDKDFSLKLLDDINSNGSIRIFERDTHVVVSCFGPQENKIYSAPDRLNCRIDVQIKTKLHLTDVFFT